MDDCFGLMQVGPARFHATEHTRQFTRDFKETIYILY